MTVIVPLDSTAPVRAGRGTLRSIGVADVRLAGGFWGELQERNSAAIVPHADHWMRTLGWYANLEHAAARERFEHRGREFADSEVSKLLEAVSWSVLRGDDRHVELLERLATVLVGAQDPDGYLHTLFGRPWQRPRYSDFQWGHELYCFGHFIQAAVAHHRATGDRLVLDAAIRLADHVCVMFGPDGLQHVCGHAEIEMALVELYREVGDRRYLAQASVFVERRGEGTIPLHEFGRAFWQDDVPVRRATVLRGHAVRALYLAAGAVDVAVETGDAELLAALVEQWETTVARRTYLTGGMGSHHMDEAFGDDYVLPPDRSYCETCAGVASIMFSWRLLLATGDARYADLIERTLFNVVATSPARDGRAFFYANTLHQRTAHTPPSLNEDGVVIRGGASGRQPWYEVSCCPPNVARTLASLGAYVATGDSAAVQVHQYAAGEIRLGSTRVRIDADYPRDGRITVTVPEAAGPVDLDLRVPSWAAGATVQRAGGSSAVAAGTYARVAGVAAGEQVVLTLPLVPRLTRPDGRIDAVRGTVAVERGPEVLVLESVDLPAGWSVDGVALDEAAGVQESAQGVTVRLRRAQTPADAPWPFGVAPVRLADEASTVPLVPYHDWAERGPSTMRVWIPVVDGRPGPAAP